MFAIALGLGLLTAVANVLGSLLAVLQHQPSRRFTAGTLGFGGGFVLAAALLEMVPESLRRGDSMPLFVALGYLIVFLIEQLLNVHLHQLPEEGDTEKGDSPSKKKGLSPSGLSPSHVPVAAGIASFIAFNVHDFIDGIAIGAGMVTDVNLGVVIFLAVLFHEVPAGFVIASIMRGAGWSRRAAVVSGLSLGLVTLVGIALPFQLGELNSFAADALLAVASGTFIYLGATLLVPLSEAGKSRAIPFLVVLGFAVFVVSNWLVGEFLPK